MPAAPVPITSFKKLLLFILPLIVLLGVAADAGAQQPLKLTEAQARQVALEADGVAPVIEEHHELEIYSNYLSSSGTWEVSWRNPFNSRRLVFVRIDDETGRIISKQIDEEAYMDILPSLSEETAIEIAREDERVAAEIEGIDEPSPTANLGEDGVWTVSFFSESGETARVLIDDIAGTINEVMVGPQVAWQMARGYDGAFGRIINEPYVWLPLCLFFLLPFVDVRRPLRLFHLDLLFLLAFTASHYYFNQGEISTSVPLVYPPLAWLFLRSVWVWFRGREGWSLTRFEEAAPRERTRPHLNFSPRILLAGLVIILIFRLVINFADSNVVDVGYSGVIGGHRILEGDTPYGTMPDDNDNGDTYGPFNYLIYVPFVKIFPWSGEWDNLYAAHAAAIFFDLLAVAGMFFAGRRLVSGSRAGNHLGIALAYAWAAYPYTTFVQNTNVNDSIVAAFLVWGFVFISRSAVAGVLLGLATQIKFFPALLGFLWTSFPDALRGWGKRLLFLTMFAAAIIVTVPVIYMGEGNLTLFWERTLDWQLNRGSPFSIWGQYPDLLGTPQRIAQYFLIALAIGSYFLPPKKDMITLAGATAALIVGFQIVQTHWFYLYIPWFFPFAFIAFLMNSEKKQARMKSATLIQ